jgi:hypothetical protein
MDFFSCLELPNDPTIKHLKRQYRKLLEIASGVPGSESRTEDLKNVYDLLLPLLRAQKAFRKKRQARAALEETKASEESPGPATTFSNASHGQQSGSRSSDEALSVDCQLDTLPAEVRLRIYHFMVPHPARILVEIPTKKPTRCPNSRVYPLLGTCSLLRREFLPYLLSMTYFTLTAGARPRKRQVEHHWPVPGWQVKLVRHVLIADALEKKMQFEMFPKLETLTLKWPVTLSITVPPDCSSTTSVYLSEDDSAEDVKTLIMSVVKASGERWIQKLLKRKRKKFALLVLAVVGCKTQMQAKGHSLIVGVTAAVVNFS